MNSAFIQMRSKPPMTTFSAKALSFYGTGNKPNGQEAILVQSADHINYATHDQNLTTNREDNGKNVTGQRLGDNMRTTASGTLSNLMESIQQVKEAPSSFMPAKQTKRYHMDLGQNVSQINTQKLAS